MRVIWYLANLGQFDHINRMITLSVITLSGFHCYTIDFIYTVLLDLDLKCFKNQTTVY